LTLKERAFVSTVMNLRDFIKEIIFLRAEKISTALAVPIEGLGSVF